MTLTIYQGWSDPVISALATIGYYEEVLAHDKKAIEDVKLFLMPGVLHCAGGKGPSSVNFLDHLDHWIETQNAPTQITAHFVDADQNRTGSRPLCAYPKRAEYIGEGSVNQVESFRCIP